MPLCIYLYIDSEIPPQIPVSHRVVSEVPTDVGDIFLQEPDATGINDSVLENRLC